MKIVYSFSLVLIVWFVNKSLVEFNYDLFSV